MKKEDNTTSKAAMKAAMIAGLIAIVLITVQAAVQITFLLLKVTGAIHWSWVAVLIPVLVLAALIILFWLYGFLTGLAKIFAGSKAEADKKADAEKKLDDINRILESIRRSEGSDKHSDADAPADGKCNSSESHE